MKYKLRAECLADIGKLLVSANYLASYEIILSDNCIDHELVIDTDPKNLTKIIACLNKIPNCHVMLETLKPINEYTGERQ